MLKQVGWMNFDFSFSYLVSAEPPVGGSGVVEAWEDFDEVVAAVLLVLHLERHEAQVDVFTWKIILSGFFLFEAQVNVFTWDIK